MDPTRLQWGAIAFSPPHPTSSLFSDQLAFQDLESPNSFSTEGLGTTVLQPGASVSSWNACPSPSSLSLQPPLFNLQHLGLSLDTLPQSDHAASSWEHPFLLCLLPFFPSFEFLDKCHFPTGLPHITSLIFYSFAFSPLLLPHSICHSGDSHVPIAWLMPVYP